MIFITVKNCVTIFGAEVPCWMRHQYVSCKKTNPQSKFRPVALQRTSNWSTFILSILLLTTIILKKFYLCFGVLAAFYTFHWTSKVYATLTMKNRFLGVQISIIWVVFAVKIVTLLWQPAKAQDIGRECHPSTETPGTKVQFMMTIHVGDSCLQVWEVTGSYS